jgi:hypothetical protein
MSEQFGSPPDGIGRSPSDGDEEAIVDEFSVPTDSEGVEPAALSGMADALAGVPAALLDVKGVIEEQLAQSASQTAHAHDVETFADAGNIQGVGIGLGVGAAELDGRGEPGSPVLTVYVAERTSSHQIRAVVAAAAGPQASAVDEVPIHVVETGIIDAQPHRFRSRPAPGGISVAHFKVTAGTIGCLSRGRSAPRNARLMVLSNNHVLANSNGGAFGDCVCQPGPFDGGRCPADQIAILERFVPINFTGGCNYVDCATAWCWPDRVRRELVYLSGGSPVYFRIGSAPIAPVLGSPVGKSGRTTQLTSGRITAIGVTVNVNYGAGRVARFCDQMAIQAASGDFSAGGDSGSSIWTWDSARRPVGLLFAGGGGTTFANRMDRVVSALDINLYT